MVFLLPGRSRVFGNSGADNLATHYHELNELASIMPNVANQVTVKELPDQIVFCTVQPGGADRSYGIKQGG